jgi:type III secretion system YscD/HrpQ family protein
MASEHPLHEFSIVAGAHHGATFTLGSDDVLVIGSDESCDICLSDAGVAARHAMLMSQAAAVTVRRLDGEVEVDGVLLDADPRATLGPGATVVIGGVQLRRAASTVPVAHATTGAPIAPRTRRRRLLPALVVGGAAIVVASLTAQKLDASRVVGADKADADAVRALLQHEGLTQQVEVTETSYGLVLNGVVEPKAAARLRSVAATVSAPIINSIISDAELLEQVREVFRTHGYDAAITYIGERRVRVDNLDENHQRVRQAAARVRSDVSQLQGLAFATAGATPPPDHLPAYDSGTADQINARVDGETAYLATSGGARYFVGSVLPGGETVRQITANAVQIDRDGQISWFGL